MARELGMRFFVRLNIDPAYSPVKDSDILRKEMGHLSIREYEDRTKDLYEFPCHQLWLAPQIAPNGELLGCCMNNQESHFGNVFEGGLRKAVKNEKYIYMKKMLLGKVKEREDIPCFNCRVYKKIRSRKANFIITSLSFLRRLLGAHFF